jgi:hypothetical protein
MLPDLGHHDIISTNFQLTQRSAVEPNSPTQTLGSGSLCFVDSKYTDWPRHMEVVYTGSDAILAGVKVERFKVKTWM